MNTDTRATKRVLRYGSAMSVAAAVLVFCAVQDRVTQAGVQEYVSLQRAASNGEGPVVTIDEVMNPWVRRSVYEALGWSGVTLAVGVATVLVAARRPGRG